MVLADFPEDRRKVLTFHSFRIWLACALLQAGATGAQIQALCRWQSEDSLRIYARLNAGAYGSLLTAAMRADVHSLRITSLRDQLPFLSKDDILLAMAERQSDAALLSATPRADELVDDPTVEAEPSLGLPVAEAAADVAPTGTLAQVTATDGAAAHATRVEDAAMVHATACADPAPPTRAPTQRRRRRALTPPAQAAVPAKRVRQKAMATPALAAAPLAGALGRPQRRALVPARTAAAFRPRRAQSDVAALVAGLPRL